MGLAHILAYPPKPHTHLFSRLNHSIPKTMDPGSYFPVLPPDSSFAPEGAGPPTELSQCRCPEVAPPWAPGWPVLLPGYAPSYPLCCPHHHPPAPCLPRSNAASQTLPPRHCLSSPDPLTHAPSVCSSLPLIFPAILAVRRRPLKCNSALLSNFL